MFNSQYSRQGVPSFSTQFDRQADTQYTQFSQQAHIIDGMAVFVAPSEGLWPELLGPNPIDEVNQLLIIF
jgi:hypothetical protein